MNQLNIIGGLTRDPESRTTQSGKQVCTFTVGVNRRNDRENEGRAPKGLPEWAKFFEGQVIDQPFYSEFTKKKKKK